RDRAVGGARVVGFATRALLEGRRSPRLEISLLEGILQGQRVDDGREHPHVVGGGPVHAAGARRDAAEDVAAADDNGHLDAQLDDLPHLGRDAVEHRRVDPVALAPGQRLTREFQDDTAVGGAWGAGVRRHGYPASPTWNREKRRTTMRSCVCAFTPSTRSLTLVLPVASFTNGCSSRHCSPNHFSSLPSTILSSTFAGF